MTKALPAVALAAVLAGCSSGAPSPTPPAREALTGGIRSDAFISTKALGAGWSAVTPTEPPCAPSYHRTATGRIGLGQERGTLTEVLSTGVDPPAVIGLWRASLQRCGYAVSEDGLGDAGIRATKGATTVVVTGSAGVLVVLDVRGRLATATDIGSWAELALGTSCVVAVGGCQ